jgi:hypothetical protein
MHTEYAYLLRCAIVFGLRNLRQRESFHPSLLLTIGGLRRLPSSLSLSRKDGFLLDASPCIECTGPDFGLRSVIEDHNTT